MTTQLKSRMTTLSSNRPEEGTRRTKMIPYAKSGKDHKKLSSHMIDLDQDEDDGLDPLDSVNYSYDMTEG